MKNERLMPSLAVFILVILLISSGCSVPSNVNVSQNQNSNSNSDSNSNSNSGANSNSGDVTPPSQCSGTDLQTIANNINTYLFNEIDSYTGSVPWRQSLTAQKLRGTFKYRAVVTQTPNYPTGTTDSVYLYIAGSIGDDRANGNPKDIFQPFLTLLKPFHLRTCVNRIVFVRLSDLKNVPSKTVAEPPIEGFDWFGCDGGNVPCPGGICAPPGSCKMVVTPTPTPTPKPDAKTAPAANSNSTSNTKSSSNSGSNNVKPKT